MSAFVAGLCVVFVLAAGCGDGAPSPPAPDGVDAAEAVERREEALAAIDRLLEARRIEEAVRVANRLAERHPEDASVALRLGRARLAERSIAAAPVSRPRPGESPDRRASEAADALLDAIAGGIEDRETFALAATLLEASDRNGEAEPLWRTLLRRDPDDVEAALRLALNLESTGRRGEAIELAEATRRRHPDHPFAAVVLGELRLATGDERGLELIAEGVRLDPENAAWRMRQAVWLRRLGRCEEAIPLLAATASDAAPDPATVREIAACWRELRRPAKAAAAWEAIAERAEPGTVWAGEAWREATSGHLEAGDREAAWRCLQRAILVDPEHPGVRMLERALEASATAATDPASRPRGSGRPNE